jgi:alcohol dehydrogenase (cytochrome c)
MRLLWLVSGSLLLSVAAGVAQAPSPGRATFERVCARCHGADGAGGEMGPGIVTRLTLRSDAELATLIREGLPAKGMPGSSLADAEMKGLIAFARTLRRGRAEPPARVSLRTADGGTLNGVALNRSAGDVQLLADDGRLRLLRRAGDAWRAVTSQTDWPTYHGDVNGNRYSTLDQIDRTSIGRLAPAWLFPLPDASRLQVTPIVASCT